MTGCQVLSLFGIFVGIDFSQAPGATATEPDELLPIAAGGDETSKEAPSAISTRI